MLTLRVVVWYIKTVGAVRRDRPFCRIMPPGPLLRFGPPREKEGGGRPALPSLRGRAACREKAPSDASLYIQ